MHFSHRTDVLDTVLTLVSGVPSMTERDLVVSAMIILEHYTLTGAERTRLRKTVYVKGVDNVHHSSRGIRTCEVQRSQIRDRPGGSERSCFFLVCTAWQPALVLPRHWPGAFPLPRLGASKGRRDRLRGPGFPFGRRSRPGPRSRSRLVFFLPPDPGWGT